MVQDAHGPFGPLDLAAGALLGFEPRDPLPGAVAGETVRTVVERHIEGALRRGPVGIPLMGGSASATLLAAALSVARERGLPAPIPLSLDIAHPETAEDAAYQALVARALGVADTWERIATDDDLQIVGPHARIVLAREGLLFPANAAWMRPLAQRIGDRGTLLLPNGDSEFLGSWPFGALYDVVRGRRRPSRQTVKLAAFAALPPQQRARTIRARVPAQDQPWLRPGVGRRIAQAGGTFYPSLSLEKTLNLMRGWRCHVALPQAYNAVAGEFGARVLLPWAQDDTVATFIANRATVDFRDPAASRRVLLPDGLPAAIPDRRDRTAYGGVFHGADTQAFAARWSGEGLDEALVDPAALRRAWRQPRFDWRGSSLMQAAWLHDAAAGRC